MHIQNQYPLPIHRKSSQTDNSDTTYVTSPYSQKEIEATPEHLLEVKAFSKSFGNILDAKHSLFNTINALKTQGLTHFSFYIWQLPKNKYNQFMNQPDDTSHLKAAFDGLQISQEYYFDPVSHSFILNKESAPETNTETDTSTNTSTPNLPNTPNLRKAYDPKKVEHVDTPESDPLSEEKTALKELKNDFTFKCTLSDPVITPDGHTYNRPDLIHHINQHSQDPKSKNSLSTRQIIPNHTLKEVFDHLPDILDGHSKELLCPISKLPLHTPILINPNTENGEKTIQHCRDPKTQAPYFETGRSINLSSLKMLRETHPEEPTLHQLKSSDLIANTHLKQVLENIEALRKKALETDTN